MATSRRLFHASVLQENQLVELDQSQSHYCIKVLRLRAGDEVFLFDNSGAEFCGRVASLNKQSVRVQIENSRFLKVESPLNTILVQGIMRGERMDYCVQKATELGVSQIMPALTQRSMVKLNDKRAKKRAEHWQKVAQSAAEQCGRVLVPSVCAPVSLTDHLETLPGAATLLRLDPGDKAQTIEHVSHVVNHPLYLLVGPEGGFSPDEIDLLDTLGSQTMRMGPRVLRSETAGITALALCQQRWGDFR